MSLISTIIKKRKDQKIGKVYALLDGMNAGAFIIILDYHKEGNKYFAYSAPSNEFIWVSKVEFDISLDSHKIEYLEDAPQAIIDELMSIFEISELNSKSKETKI